MHIDEFTYVIPMSGSGDPELFLYNLRTGAVDVVRGGVALQLNALMEKSSFEPGCTGLSGDVVTYLMQRGHLSVHSMFEARRDALLRVERARKRILVQEPEVGLLIRKEVAMNICPFHEDKRFERKADDAVDMEAWERLLPMISRMSRRLGIYLRGDDVFRFRPLIEKCIAKSKAEGVIHVTVYAQVEEEGEADKVCALAEREVDCVTTVIITKRNQIKMEKGVRTQRQPMVSLYPFLCPFVYRVLFVNEKGWIDFCPYLTEKEDHMGALIPEYSVKEGWESEWWSPLCKETEHFCTWRHLCTKRCPQLKAALGKNMYMKIGTSSCAVVDRLEEVLQELSCSLIGEGERRAKGSSYL